MSFVITFFKYKNGLIPTFIKNSLRHLNDGNESGVKVKAWVSMSGSILANMSCFQSRWSLVQKESPSCSKP